MIDKETRDDSSGELEEVWSLFAEDGREALDVVEETLLELEADPTDTGQVARLFRGLHTFKGNARMMGLSVIESLAHHAEDLVTLVRDEGVILTSAMVDLLLEVLDHSRVMLDYALAHRLDADTTQVEELVMRLEAMVADNCRRQGPSEKPDSRPADEVLGVHVAGEALEPVLAEQFIDPATDPAYVRIFLELAEDELGHLLPALDALVSEDEEEKEEGIQEIKAAASTLGHAAGRMGYEHLVALLGDLVTAVEEMSGEALSVRLDELRSALSKEVIAIQEGAQSLGLEVSAWSSLHRPKSYGDAGSGTVIPDVSDAPDAPRLFKRWCVEGTRADLARLGEVASGLERFRRQLLADGSALARDEELALVDEATFLLRAIYQTCTFYELRQAARLTLALEDLYTRVAQGEMTINEDLLNLTHTCVTQLSGALETICRDDAPELATLVGSLEQTEEILSLCAESRVMQVAKDVLDLLDLPPEFKAVMTQENLLEFSRALQAGETFYTLLADLNQDDEMGQAFCERSQSNGVRLITNVTVYRDNRTLFDFLLATPQPREAVLEIFNELDPQGRHFSLKGCTLREGTGVEDVVSAPPVRRPDRSAVRVIAGHNAISMDALAGFVEDVGRLVATRATLHRVAERLTEVDLIETVTRLVRRSGGDWRRVRDELQVSLGLWTDDLSTLSHLETEMGAALDRFRETALALRARPVSELLDPLQRLVQDMAQSQGKMVELDLGGMDIKLDHSVLDVLISPVRRLVWFAVVHSIEKPWQRRQAGKPVIGHVSVGVRKTASRAQVVIEDDGRGIDLEDEAILERARELGWTNGSGILAGSLFEWVLRDGFGAVGGCDDIKGVDLAAINAELQAHRGRLSVASAPGEGTRFLLDIPLDTVVIDGMVMRAGDRRYVVPIEAVRWIVKPDESQIVYSSAGGGQGMLRLEERLVPIRSLVGSAGQRRLFYNDARDSTPPVLWQREPASEGLLLVVEAGGQDVALAVDDVLGQQQVLTQPLRGHLAGIPGVSGCALLGEDNVGVILDLNQIDSSCLLTP
jgi:two-component system chemotaxis sensor kinase CheA